MVSDVGEDIAETEWSPRSFQVRSLTLPYTPGKQKGQRLREELELGEWRPPDKHDFNECMCVCWGRTTIKSD